MDPYDAQEGVDPEAPMSTEDLLLEETQEPTQEATQSQSQLQDPMPSESRENCWGWLQPCSTNLKRAVFERPFNNYIIGRGKDVHIHMAGNKVSNKHCEMRWDGRDVRDAIVTITDMSSNGTYVNGERIEKYKSRVVKDGFEVAFGSAATRDSYDDYRFIFRQNTAQPEGVWASYDMGKELGKGTFASVFSAMNRQTGQWYAVKMIRLARVKQREDDLDPQGNPKNPYQREIDVLQSLHHPNICRLREVFLEPDLLNLVLELVTGGDLLDRILKREGLPEAEARDILYQTCDALKYVHSQGIAHRDLKPENILLTRDPFPIVKIADFGLAKLIDSQTMLRTMCGTPSYLAPEVVMQINGSGYDLLVDSWSVGVIAFSAVTNCAPFNENTEDDVKSRIANRTIEWPILYEHGMSDKCNDFIRQLLERDPGKRLTMAGAMDHPWLISHTPMYKRNADFEAHLERWDVGPGKFIPKRRQLTEAMAIDISPSQESSSSTGVSRIPGAYPRKTQTLNIVLPSDVPHVPAVATPVAKPRAVAALAGSPARREGSQLVRRVHVLEQAAENGGHLADIPEEMVSGEEARRRAESTRTAASPRPTPGPRGAKRKSPAGRGNSIDASMEDATAAGGPNKRAARAPPRRPAPPPSPAKDSEEEGADDLPHVARRSSRNRK